MTAPALAPAVLESIVRRFAWATRGGALDLDDLRQVGRQAVLEAHMKFDAERGTAFSSFAYLRAAQRVAQYANEQRTAVRVPSETRRHRRQHGFDAPHVSCTSVDAMRTDSNDRGSDLLDIEGHHTPAHDLAPDAMRLPWRVEWTLAQVAARSSRGSGPRWVQLLRWVHFDDLPLAECARRLGCTHQNVGQQYAKARDEFARQWALAGWEVP